LVRDPEGERVCFLSGQRAVVGDRVQWQDAPGSGGKLVAVEARDTVLTRVDRKGKEQVLAANLSGLLVVASVAEPPFRAGLLDRYLVAAAAAGLDCAVCLNKIDLEAEPSVAQDVALREAVGVEFVSVSALTGEGLQALRDQLQIWSTDGPWALVGHSGVGKTSLIGALLPGQDVGPVGEISEYWGTGQHTTTASRIFALGRGEVVDSPGIRTFAPGGIDPNEMRLHFPGIRALRCQYRNCLHRDSESGCVAEAEVDPDLLGSYRRLLDELLEIEARRRP